jgi:uncharacterized protein with HEPN domain
MRSDELYLRDITEACDAISAFVRSVSEEDFYVNDMLFSAVMHKQAIIGEAAAHVSEPVRLLRPDVKWKRIAGFRNVIVHAYFSGDETIIWNAATTEVPALRDAVADILARHYA